MIVVRSNRDGFTIVPVPEGASMEDRIKALEKKIVEFEERITALEEWTGVNDFDANYHRSTSLHRRIDYLEDWRRDVNE